MSTEPPLPAWAENVRRKYVGGEASMFVLHLNVFDQVLHGDKSYSLVEFLGQVLLRENKQNIMVFDPASGVRLLKHTPEVGRIAELRERKDPEKSLRVLEAVLMATDSTALIIDYAGSVAPEAEMHMLSEADRLAIITLHRWSQSRTLSDKDNVVFLLTETLPELSHKLVGNPRVAAVEIPLPGPEERTAAIRRADPSIDEPHVRTLAAHTSGLRTVQIDALLRPRRVDFDDASREQVIRELLAGGADAEARASKLAALTRGMSREEIQHLIHPDRPLADVDPSDAYAEVLELVHHRKREIIEKECAGLIEFVRPSHDLSVVGGCDGVIAELRQIAAVIRSGETARVPMGLLFVGPMGAGKTFVANAFIKESGLSAVKLKNFRSKWVGSTESNLEKVLSMVRSLGPIVLVIDEGDRAFGSDGEGDGGTGSRVIGRIKEFMSEPDNRGRVLFILMTNRPDKLDVDIKRAGRLDRKIPFFYPERPQDVEAVISAICRRYKIALSIDWAKERERTSVPLCGYSNADLEAVALLAHDMASARGTAVDVELLVQAIADYLPPRDTAMLEYMELLAVFEASRRSMLPERYRALNTEQLNELLRERRRALRI